MPGLALVFTFFATGMPVATVGIRLAGGRIPPGVRAGPVEAMMDVMQALPHTARIYR